MSHISMPDSVNPSTASDISEKISVSETTFLDQRLDVHSGLQWIIDQIGPAVIVLIHPETGGIAGRWLDAATIAPVSSWAASENAQGWNVYFTVNLPKVGLSKKPTKQEIVGIRAAAYADIDAKAGRSLDQAREAISVLPTPSVIIVTGGGYQPIWLLPEPLPTTPETVARVEALSDYIAKMAGGDAIKNVDRILRVPYTMNHPNASKIKAGRAPVPSGLLIIGGLPT